MVEKLLTDTEAEALLGTTDSVSGIVYPQLAANRWGASFAKMAERIIATSILGNNLRVYKVDGNADAVGIRAGRVTISSVVLSYAGEDPAVDGLADNDTTYIWIEDVGSVATIDSAIDGTGWPGGAHFKLAEVTMSSGAITTLTDRRTDEIFTA